MPQAKESAEKYLIVGIIYSRVMQLYYHYCHNLVYGCSYHSDHAFFGEAYASMEEDYDSLVEYFIALYGSKKFKTAKINELIMEELAEVSVEDMKCSDMYKTAIEMENKFQGFLTKINTNESLGLQNAVQGMATKSDVRLYKMKQRVKDDSNDE